MHKEFHPNILILSIFILIPNFFQNHMLSQCKVSCKTEAVGSNHMKAFKLNLSHITMYLFVLLSGYLTQSGPLCSLNSMPLKPMASLGINF